MISPDAYPDTTLDLALPHASRRCVAVDGREGVGIGLAVENTAYQTHLVRGPSMAFNVTI